MPNRVTGGTHLDACLAKQRVFQPSLKYPKSVTTVVALPVLTTYAMGLLIGLDS